MNQINVIGATAPFEIETYEEMAKYSEKYRDYQNNIIVEIGSSDNSYYLNEPLSSKFTGILVDGSSQKLSRYTNPSFKTVCKMINPDNVCSILEENNIPEDFYMLNLDIDGLDFFTLISILKKYRPKVIITEFNEKIPYPFKYSIKNDSNFTWGWCHNYGYSVACIKDVMLNFGYRIDSLNVNNIYLSRIDDDSVPNVEDVKNWYKIGYLDKKQWVDDNFQPWNKDVNHLHLCKSEEEMEKSLKEYFTNNVNVNNGKTMIDEIDKYLINNSYEEYLNDFLKIK
jgi:hypothetical protein